MDRLRVTHALELALLQHAQQFDLQHAGGGVDFVEEDGAGVGGLEAPGAVLDGAGERAVHVAEQLAFQQILAQRPAIDAHKRSARPIAQLVDGRGDQLLAGAGLAQQQDRGVAARDTSRRAIHLLHGRAGADNAGDRRPALVHVVGDVTGHNSVLLP